MKKHTIELKDLINSLKHRTYAQFMDNVLPKRTRKRPITRNKRQYILK
jgi:hypothetical protein